MSEEIGKIIPLETLEKLYEIVKNRRFTEHDQVMASFLDWDLVGNNRIADEALKKYVEARKNQTSQ